MNSMRALPSQLACFQNQDSHSSSTLPVPSDCKESPADECFYYLAVQCNPVNDSYAAFQLVATAQGYVAFEFSRERLNNGKRRRDWL